MSDRLFDEIAPVLAGGVAPRRTVLAAVMAAGLVLAARGQALAAGKLGSAGGFDRNSSVTTTGGKVGGSMDRPARLGGKLGIGAGDE